MLFGSNSWFIDLDFDLDRRHRHSDNDNPLVAHSTGNNSSSADGDVWCEIAAATIPLTVGVEAIPVIISRKTSSPVAPGPID